MLSPSLRAFAPVQQQVSRTCEQDLRRVAAKVRLLIQGLPRRFRPPSTCKRHPWTYC